MAHNHFDPQLATLHKKDLFKPLRVEKTILLRDALKQGKIKSDTDLLLLNHPDEPLALVKGEMAYHHVAQGHLGGEPYLVSF